MEEEFKDDEEYFKDKLLIETSQTATVFRSGQMIFIVHSND